ncbi:MAG: winged helix-turn-helix transcriptional regulator, partial [Gammaproteobacteria bacterium]
MNSPDRKDSLTLGILESIDNQSDLTQRHLADKLGVALGLANSYLKRCVRKGLIKIEHAPANRYLYYLTPTGFAEKSRLTAEYLTTSFDFYRQASEACSRVFEECRVHKYRKVLLCGISELAEIASLRAREQNIEIIGIWQPGTRKRKHIGIPMYTDFESIPEYDVCVLTAIKQPQEMLHELENQ